MLSNFNFVVGAVKSNVAILLVALEGTNETLTVSAVSFGLKLTFIPVTGIPGGN